MDLNDFINGFSELFDDTDVSDIRATTAFQDLDEWSSLLAMGVIAFAKTVFGKEITGKDIRSCTTVVDLYNLVVSE